MPTETEHPGGGPDEPEDGPSPLPDFRNLFAIYLQQRSLLGGLDWSSTAVQIDAAEVMTVRPA